MGYVGAFVALVVAATLSAPTITRAEMASGQDHGQSQQRQDQMKSGQHRSGELGLQQQSERQGHDQRSLGAGPMGEEEKGGGGQSGTKGLPPGSAPQFEGAGQQTSPGGQ